MSVQDNYNEMAYAQRGVINGVEPSTTVSIRAVAATPFAVGVKRDGSAGLAATGPLFGIVAQHQQTEASYRPFSEVTSFPDNTTMPVLREGSVWVELADATAVVVGENIGINTAGEFASSTVGGFEAVTNVTVADVRETGMYVDDVSLVLVRIDIDPSV